MRQRDVLIPGVVLGSGIEIFYTKNGTCVVAQGWEGIPRLHFDISFFFSILFYVG